MFDDLRAAFREAIDNFNKELNRDQVPETVDRLLRGMKSELGDAKALVADLESQVAKALAQAESEKAQADTCRRREQMAREIGDEETATLALKYCKKHEARRHLLEQKAVALREELTFRERDYAEMMAKFKEAQESRNSLTATTGRSEARHSISEADDLFRELDRMAEKIEGEKARGEAAQEFDAIDFDSAEGPDYHVDLDEPAPREELDVDAALAELKRRMSEE